MEIGPSLLEPITFALTGGAGSTFVWTEPSLMVKSSNLDTDFGKRFILNDEIRYPSVKQVDRLYDKVIRETGGEHGYLSKSNLEYLLDAVRDIGERLGREQALVKKAAFLLYNIVVLHPFVNGNKRTAYELVRLFLRLNGYEIQANSDDAYRFLLEVASGKATASNVDSWIGMNLTALKG